MQNQSPADNTSSTTNNNKNVESASSAPQVQNPTVGSDLLVAHNKGKNHVSVGKLNNADDTVSLHPSGDEDYLHNSDNDNLDTRKRDSRPRSRSPHQNSEDSDGNLSDACHPKDGDGDE